MIIVTSDAWKTYDDAKHAGMEQICEIPSGRIVAGIEKWLDTFSADIYILFQSDDVEFKDIIAGIQLMNGIQSGHIKPTKGDTQ
jgi:hypothetical protein